MVTAPAADAASRRAGSGRRPARAITGSGSVRIDLDAHVRQPFDPGQPRLVVVGRPRMLRYDHREDAEVAGTEPPHMEIGDAIGIDLEPLADQAGAAAVRNGVE